MASKLGSKQYFGGDNLSDADEKAFTTLLSIGEDKIEELGSKNLKKWFTEMKLEQAEEVGQCSYCEARINIPLYKVKIAAIVSEDAIIPCPKCVGHHRNLREFEEDL